MGAKLHHSQHQPEKRTLQLSLLGFELNCSVLIYRGTTGVLVIITCTESSYESYFHRPELAAIAVCELFKIDARTLLWVEHQEEKGENGYTHVLFDRGVAFDENQTIMLGTFRNPQRKRLPNEQAVRALQTSIGFSTEGNEFGPN